MRFLMKRKFFRVFVCDNQVGFCGFLRVLFINLDIYVLLFIIPVLF